MGYTHYWTFARPITNEEVAALGNDIRDIILASELPIVWAAYEGWIEPNDLGLSLAVIAEVRANTRLRT